MLKQSPAKRANVTVDDRRAVLVIASARKPKDVAEMSHENFLRNALKDRLAWPRRDPAPDAVKQAAKHMAQGLIARGQARFEAQKAQAAALAEAEAAAKAKQEADEKRWAEMSLKEHLAEMGADSETIAQVQN